MDKLSRAISNIISVRDDLERCLPIFRGNGMDGTAEEVFESVRELNEALTDIKDWRNTRQSPERRDYENILSNLVEALSDYGFDMDIAPAMRETYNEAWDAVCKEKGAETEMCRMCKQAPTDGLGLHGELCKDCDHIMRLECM